MKDSARNRKKHGPEKIGFAGCPPAEVLNKFSGCELIDLDNRLAAVAGNPSEKLLPATSCRIIKRILDNALGLDLDTIILDDGYSKCDNARFLGLILEELLPEVQLIRTQNNDTSPKGTPVCDSTLPLTEKVEWILEDLIVPGENKLQPPPQPCQSPPFAFWGVPCADESVYELFPPGTQVLGWLRCFENRTPADLDLECWVPPGIPTVFFAQTFCSKNILAKHMAAKYNGLYVDVDGTLSRSEHAKIEAFLHFRRTGH